MTAASVEHALSILAARTAGGRSHFQGFDVDLGHTLASRVEQGLELSDKQQAVAYRLLRKYAEPLAALGVPSVAVPAGLLSADGEAPEEEAGQPGGDGPDLAAAQPPSGVRIACQGEKIVVRGTKYTDADLMRSIPNGRWVKSNVAWVFPATPTAAKTIAQRLAALRPEMSEGVLALVAEAEALKDHAAVKDAENLPPIPGEKTTSWMHQRRAVAFAEKLPGAILAMAMGTGKSKCAIELIRLSGAKRVLIMAPDRCVDVWPLQAQTHWGDHAVHIDNGKRTNRSGKRAMLSIKDRTRAYDELVNDCRCGRVHIAVANFASAGYEPFASWALSQEWDYLIADEIHRWKTPGGVWAKWAAKMVKNSKRRLGLTGTLLPQTPLDCFSQYRAIDPDVFGRSNISFTKRFALFGGYENHEFLGMNPATFPEFSEKLHSIAYMCDADMLDLPEVLPEVTYTCQLGPAGAKAYKQMDSELFALLQTMDITEAISASNVLVKMLRLQQICGGAVHAESGDYVEIDTSKATLLTEVLEDISADDPVVVFCRFVHDLDAVQRVAAKLGRRYGELSGRRDDALTSDATLAEGIQVAAVQLQSGGVGIDLSRAHFGIYYSVSFGLADFLQSKARLQRPGQKESVRFIHLVADGTIDQTVYEALAHRKSVVEYAIAKRMEQG